VVRRKRELEIRESRLSQEEISYMLLNIYQIIIMSYQVPQITA